ncbi:hypothetical protein [Sporosarcina sp. UB5]|uniref:hypothetical protein n=1 Tax=Sporosarcina sp. UB5 TaxID=3047463 RepID=UPI003D79E519
MKKLFCTCAKDSIAKMERRLFPKICIGHVALFLTGVFLVIMQLLYNNPID